MKTFYYCLRLAVTTSQPRFKTLEKRNAISPTRFVAEK